MNRFKHDYPGLVDNYEDTLVDLIPFFGIKYCLENKEKVSKKLCSVFCENGKLKGIEELLLWFYFVEYFIFLLKILLYIFFYVLIWKYSF